MALRKKINNIKINYEEWVKIYSAAKCVLVIHYQDPVVPCYQASPKLFEALACGCFVFSDAQRDVQSLFQDSRHLVMVQNPADLRKKLEYYLSHSEKRDIIAREGYREATEKHTYKDRIQNIIEILQS